MQRVVSISASNRNILGRRNKTVGREITIGPNAIKFVTIAIFAVLAIVYLTQSTSGANRGIKIRDLQDKESQITLEKERLEVEQTRLQSLQEIDNGTEKNVMESVTEVGRVNP